MFWIIFWIIFIALCTALVLIVRSRGGGAVRGGTDENHNALQNGTLKMYAQRNGNGPTPPTG